MLERRAIIAYDYDYKTIIVVTTSVIIFIDIFGCYIGNY